MKRARLIMECRLIGTAKYDAGKNVIAEIKAQEGSIFRSPASRREANGPESSRFQLDTTRDNVFLQTAIASLDAGFPAEPSWVCFATCRYREESPGARKPTAPRFCTYDPAIDRRDSRGVVRSRYTAQGSGVFANYSQWALRGFPELPHPTLPRTARLSVIVGF